MEPFTESAELVSSLFQQSRVPSGTFFLRQAPVGYEELLFLGMEIWWVRREDRQTLVTDSSPIHLTNKEQRNNSIY